MLSKFFIFLIKIYQKTFSKALPPSCRFYPSCSQYSIDAYTKYGFLKGTIKSVKRILKCNPLNPGGYDPA